MSKGNNNNQPTTDEIAAKLANLQVKRERTLAEIDMMQKAARSTRRSIEAYGPKQNDLMETYKKRTEDDDLSAEDMKKVLTEWQEALTRGVDEFNGLLAEWDRLRMQERILVQMVIELDNQIEDLREELVS